MCSRDFHRLDHARKVAITFRLTTAHCATPLRQHFRADTDLPIVRADAEGTMRGEALEPLYRSVARAARADAQLYEWLALVDASHCRALVDGGLTIGSRRSCAVGFQEDTILGAPICRGLSKA